MKIVRFRTEGDVKYGILTGQHIQAIKGGLFGSLKTTELGYQLRRVKLLAPCVPSKVVAVGRNYRSHAAEVNQPLPDVPFIFLKPSTSVIGPEENILYPETSHQVDYEGELGVVIKKRAWQVSAAKALDYVLGYTCFNDVTARDIQSHEKQSTRAKIFDTFAAFGPVIETELDPAKAAVETYLNGELKQQDNTRNLIFPVTELISFISHVVTLLPGDVIATGTPSGIGPMQPGDTIEVRIAGIGTLRNYVTKDSK